MRVFTWFLMSSSLRPSPIEALSIMDSRKANLFFSPKTHLISDNSIHGFLTGFEYLTQNWPTSSSTSRSSFRPAYPKVGFSFDFSSSLLSLISLAACEDENLFCAKSSFFFLKTWTQITPLIPLSEFYRKEMDTWANSPCWWKRGWCWGVCRGAGRACSTGIMFQVSTTVWSASRVGYRTFCNLFID